MRIRENALKTHRDAFVLHALGLAAAGVLSLALCGFGIGQTTGEQKKSDVAAVTALPRDVRAALDRAGQVYPTPLRGARWTEVFVLGKTDHPLYQVQGTNERGNKIEIEITSAGRILEVEEKGIPLSEVPAAVLEVLKAKMPQGNVEFIEAIYQAENPTPVCYGFEGQSAGAKAIEVYISADGKTFWN